MQIQKIKLAQLAPNTGQIPGLPSNPRQWTKSDVDRIAKSLAETPELFEARPIIAYPFDGKFVILGGNLRYEGARKNKDTEAPVIVLPEDTPTDKLKEIVIKDNGNFGAWDYDALANEWDDLPLGDWGVPAWSKEEEKSLDGISDEVKEDEFDEDVETRCQPGDIWQLGNHRLMCGDSLQEETFEKLMAGELADMVFTDPPYGVSYTDKNEFLNRIDKPICVVNPIQNDNKSPAEMADFWARAFALLAKFTKDKMCYYITAPQGGELLLLQKAVQESPFALKHMLIWNKNNHVLGRCDYNYKHEPIIYGWKKKGTHTFYGGGKFKTTVWDIPKPQRNDLHPTMKPIELVANCMLDGSKAGGIVLDSFLGSGTTIIAAEQTGRKCYGVELDPHYCDIILARWEKLTGQTATKI